MKKCGKCNSTEFAKNGRCIPCRRVNDKQYKKNKRARLAADASFQSVIARILASKW